jgi:aryl-alcohol dehydrogenase-like predicted oxidoreductase
MRYRPFGNSGKAVSAISLMLRESPTVPTASAWRARLYSAFECGINCFEVVDGGPVLTAGLAAALPAIERGLLFLGWRILGDRRRALDAATLTHILRQALQQTGAGYFDVLSLDQIALEMLTPDGRTLLTDIHSAGLALQIGFAGDGEGVETIIDDPMFEVLATSFNLSSDWRTRRLVKEATAKGMTGIAYDALPQALLAPPAPPPKTHSLLHRKPAHPLAGAGTYAFLHATPGWTAEELCVAYALTEPSFATVQLDAVAGIDFEQLAAVTDRDMPTGVAAQIEMARFGAEQTAEPRRA